MYDKAFVSTSCKIVEGSKALFEHVHVHIFTIVLAYCKTGPLVVKYMYSVPGTYAPHMHVPYMHAPMYIHVHLCVHVSPLCRLWMFRRWRT